MRNQPHKPTSADIARLAGVSRSTVSRVVNGYENVPEGTRKRINAVIERCGYYPSVSGQTLRGKRARCICVFSGVDGMRDETRAAMLLAFSKSAQALGYMTLSGPEGDYGAADSRRTVREVLCCGCVDAGVFLSASGGETLLRQLLAEGQTIGVIGTPADGGGRLFTVEPDPRAAREAAEYAFSLGYRRALVLGSTRSCPGGDALPERFIGIAREIGLDIERTQLTDSLSARRAADAALSRRDGARLLICLDQEAVFAAYRAAWAQGLAVGRDLSVLGIGLLSPDLPLWPPLTAFRADAQELADSLARRLIGSLEGEAEVLHHERIPCVRLEGGSCARGTA
ncbi:MAG: LacI family transcriptional regulator [Clostridiales bacterium]|nr:LacI family transcriptional regulator [Clostridiales bacterium]